MNRYKHLVAYVLLTLAAVWSLASIHSQESSLQKTQRTLHTSIKQSTQTRVTTVEQRCTLTRLVLQALTTSSPRSSVLPQLRISLAGCERQLQTVKEIDAHTPKVN